MITILPLYAFPVVPSSIDMALLTEFNPSPSHTPSALAKGAELPDKRATPGVPVVGAHVGSTHATLARESCTTVHYSPVIDD